MSIDIIITENPHYDANMAFVENITAKVDGVFSWTIEAFGGFATAHFEMVVPEADAWEMLNRIGKRVAFLSPDAPDSSLVCWEGMISTVNIDDGGATVSRSLDNVYNSIRVNFTGIETTTSPPTNRGYMGTPTRTDETSAALYGKRSMLYQAGEIYASGWQWPRVPMSMAETMRNLFLAQFANPRAGTTTLRRGGGSSVSSVRVSVDCVGFAQEFAVHFHGEIGREEVAVSDILTAIISNVGYGTDEDWTPYGGIGNKAAYVLSWALQFTSTDTTGVTANTLTTTRYNFTDKTTRTYLDELMRFGLNTTGDDADTRRAFWGIYENRKFFYTIEPQTADYITRRSDPSESIIDRVTGNIVPPWLVRPAKAILIPDLMPDETVVSDVLNTARSFLIGTVEFTAPATVVLTPVAPDPSGMWGTARLIMEGYAPTAQGDANGLMPWDYGYSGGILPPIGGRS